MKRARSGGEAWFKPLLVVWAAALGFCLGTACYAKPQSVNYAYRVVNHIPADVVTINLNDPEVKVTLVVARKGIGTSEPFRWMMRRTHPDAAITGTYFGLRDLWPTGTMILDGELIHSGRVGSAIALTPFNQVTFVHSGLRSVSDWSGYELVLRAGPSLVTKGRILLDPRAQGFHDRSLFRKRPRTAIGVTGNNKLLMVAVPKPVYFRQLAGVMKGLGAVEAVALDGGSSTALFFRGDFKVRTGRRLTNVLAVYSRGRAGPSVAGTPRVTRTVPTAQTRPAAAPAT